MITNEDEAEEETDTEEKSTPIEEREMEASLNSSSVIEINTPKTMKVLGSMNREEVVLLLDSGTTYNFISKKLVSELKIPVKPVKFAVVLRDSRKVSSLGKCQGVVVHIQGIEIIQNFLLFQLGGVDLILGVDWLGRLGEVKINWGSLLNYHGEEKRW